MKLYCYNNLPEKIKEPPKRLFMSKKRIKEFINNEYIICKEKNCQSCEDTIKLKTTTMGWRKYLLLIYKIIN